MRQTKASLFRKFLFALLVVGLWSCAEDQGPDSPGAIRDNYLGVWQVTENTGRNAPQVYQVEILAGPGTSDIVIEDLYNVSGTAVDALVDGTDLSIANQSSQNITFSGSGTARNNYERIDLNFTANDGTGPDQVSAVFRR